MTHPNMFTGELEIYGTGPGGWSALIHVVKFEDVDFQYVVDVEESYRKSGWVQRKEFKGTSTYRIQMMRLVPSEQPDD